MREPHSPDIYRATNDLVAQLEASAREIQRRADATRQAIDSSRQALKKATVADCLAASQSRFAP